MGKWNYRAIPKVKTWSYFLTIPKYPQETWDNLEFGLRKGDNPQVICTTTPRPIKIIKDLIADKRTVETRGNTLDNTANLNPYSSKGCSQNTKARG